MNLHADNVAFSYGATPVLRGVTLHVNPGEIVALLGPNGSGKSTLLRCLLGQLPATGTIFWDERPVASWPVRDLAKKVAYLAQSAGAEDEMTVSDVLRMGRAPYLRGFGVESLRDAACVNETAARLALTDLLHRPMNELSGGQQRRVLLGRCLVQEPSVLLLDEPSTFLDLRHQADLGRLLRRLARGQGLAVLMASHDINLASQFADRMPILHDGRIVADGAPASVLDPDLLSRVYGVEMTRVESGENVFVFPLLRDATPG